MAAGEQRNHLGPGQSAYYTFLGGGAFAPRGTGAQQFPRALLAFPLTIKNRRAVCCPECDAEPVAQRAAQVHLGDA